MQEIATAVRLRRTVIHLARKFNAAASDEGLTPSQASTLALVAARGPLPVSEIAHADSLNPTMVSRIVGALEAKGLVERIRSADDRRSFTVAATAEGDHLQARIRDQRVATIVEGARHLTPAQQASISDALDALESLIDAMP